MIPTQDPSSSQISSETPDASLASNHAANANPSKLELEIQKLRGELQHQAAQAQLTIDKLRLESEKLQLEIFRSAAFDPLAQEKLQLDIRELKRSPWLRPGTIIPLAATIGTILFAQFQGVFDVAQRRLELSHIKLQIDSSNLTAANEQLKGKREIIDRDIRNLAQDRQQLQETLQGLRRDKAILEERVHGATLALDTMGQRLKQIQFQAQIADEKARMSYPAFRSQVLAEIHGRVKSSCRVTAMPLYIDDRVAPAHLEVRPRAAESPLLRMSRSGCIQEMVESTAAIHKLEPKDLGTLAENVRLLSSQIEEIRRQALAAYADDRLTSGPWTLGLPLEAPLSNTLRASINEKRTAQPLPTTEPQRSQWIEWRRRYLVELHYLNQTNRLLGVDWLKLADAQ